MKDTNKQRVIDFLKKSNIDIDFQYYLEGEEFSSASDVESILNDAGAFDVEVIYYSNAINILAEHDPSLRRSLEAAHDLGYTADKINSELLASLLMSEIVREEFSDIYSDLDGLLNEIEHEEANEEEEEEE
jgi:hypothetical protein